MNGESGKEKYTLPYGKQRASGNVLYGSELNRVLCDNLEGWDGVGGGREVQGGNICIPMADSCWCMAETNTILESSYPSGEGNSNPLQYSCLENSVDRGAWWAAVHAVTQSWKRLKWLCMHALEKEMATHSSILAWRIPGTVEPGGLPSMGWHRVGNNWSDLAAAAVILQLKTSIFFKKSKGDF